MYWLEAGVVGDAEEGAVMVERTVETALWAGRAWRVRRRRRVVRVGGDEGLGICMVVVDAGFCRWKRFVSFFLGVEESW